MLLLTALSACAVADGPRAVPVQAASAVPEPVSTAAPAPAPTVEIPARIVGLDRAAVADLFGEPALIRRDPPAEVWQYRDARCVLDLFLYDEAGGQRVTYLEARTHAAKPLPTEGCVASVLAGPQSRAASRTAG